MNPIPLLLCALPALVPPLPSGTGVCSNVRSMTDVWDRTAPTIAYGFALTGTVHSAGEAAFVFDDGEQLIPVINRTDPAIRPNAGDRIAMSGVFGLKKVAYGNEPYTVVTRAEVLESGPAPLPARRSLQDLSGSRDDLRLVETSGTVIDCRPDDADPDYLHLILKDGPTVLPVSIRSKDADSVSRLIDARVSVIGTFNRTIQGVRRYSRPVIIATREQIRVLEPPPAPETIPVLERKIYLTPDDILSLGKRKLGGEIIAVWRRCNLLLRDDDGRVVRARLSRHNETPPRSGQRATVCGYPGTDQFNLVLGTATILSAAPGSAAPQPSVRLKSLTEIIDRTTPGVSSFKTSFYGKTVTLAGTVRTLPSSGDAEGRIGLDCDGHLVQLDTSSAPETAAGLELGCRIEATGVCLLEINNDDDQTDLPRISGLTLLLRDRNDIVVRSRPPWLTSARFFLILSVMAAILVAILLWNASLRILVERRGRELVRKQSEAMKARFKTIERTRLATELHDSVVQNLTGAALEIRAARTALPESGSDAAPHLDIALKTINSSRAELRNCIWDLRNRALEERDVDEAIRITLQPHVGDAELQVRFNVPRRKIPDNEFHAILCMIRELVVNAIRHGHAKTIKVAGTLDQGRIRFSVTDDGCGFDPKLAPGMEQGHFGIEGVTERAKALNGTAVIDSAPGEGTRVSVTVMLLEDADS